MSVDCRIICNGILDEADRQAISISNIALQKLLYFTHALHLIDEKAPLVSGYFEAWQFGPVHPAAYQAFKKSGGKPIHFRAESKDPLTGAPRPLPACLKPKVNRLLTQVVSSYGRLTPGRLVEISHAPNSPWHFVVNEAKTHMAFGMRITDDIISDRFKFHKITIRVEPASGEPLEDAPFAGTGFGEDRSSSG